jgi:hypothetical protein
MKEWLTVSSYMHAHLPLYAVVQQWLPQGAP